MNFEGVLKRLFILGLFTQTLFCQQSFPSKEYYNKEEYRIPMRDGVRLFTAVYTPKDTTQTYPILLQRTPYSVAPYGKEKYRSQLGPSQKMAESGYIFVYQDVRGKFMSEGRYVNMRPYIPHKTNARQIDEATDTYDTIEWLIHNIPHNNGRVGMWGISYPGFYTAMGLIDAHPSLKAASPQAPIADWFIGDDMHHNGAFSLNLAFNFYSVFGLPRPHPTTKWPKRFEHKTPDGYDFFLKMGALKQANERYFHHKIAFWDSLMSHSTYDAFWQKRNILPHLHNIKPAVLVVGGWYDAEDLYGTLHIYKQIEKEDSTSKNFLVMGPWYHGGWARSDGDKLGDIRFGRKTSVFFRDSIEFPFFEYYLKQRKSFQTDGVVCFDGGNNQWHTFRQWPPAGVAPATFYLDAQQQLSSEPPITSEALYDEFISDPDKPVPFIDKITTRWDRRYMVSDQRFAARRPDVLEYKTGALSHPVTIAGEIKAKLYISSSGSDADWIIKIIDVYPDSAADYQPNPCGVRMGGYQRLVRAEIMRSKFRKSYAHPIPLKPNEITPIEIRLQDVFHTFERSHRIMVQIQSSWFPLFDRNPQKFLYIYQAEDRDFQKAVQHIYHSARYPSAINLDLLPPDSL